MNHALDIIKDIATYMDGELPVFHNVYPHLVQIQDGDGKVYPAQFNQGEYSKILSFGDGNTLYFRLDPVADISETERRVSSCADTFTERHRGRMVGIWRNTGYDDRSYDILTLAKLKLAEYAPTVAVAPISRMRVVLTGQNLGKWDVWREEFRNIDYSLHSNHVMFVVNFDLIFEYDRTDCIESLIPCCDGI